MSLFGGVDAVGTKEFFEFMTEQERRADVDEFNVFTGRDFFGQRTVMLLPAVQHTYVAQPAEEDIVIVISVVI